MNSGLDIVASAVHAQSRPRFQYTVDSRQPAAVIISGVAASMKRRSDSEIA